jgi:AcrR family transcriptional regulator
MTEHNGSGTSADSDPRPVGRDEVVQATIRAAAELFAQRNPSQVSVREIATRAGVSHALVHRYLGTKDDIFRAALALDRQEAAEYWISDHGMGRTAGTFEEDLPPGRYIRTIMRASLDGVPMSVADMKFPHADKMLEFLRSTEFPSVEDAPGFDVRLLFSAVTAMAAGMAVAEEFFLVQSGLEGDDREHVHAELNRLIMRVMTLADRSKV